MKITDAMVEAATMALLGKTADPLPGVDWWASRQWRVSKVREKMRKALEAAALAGGAPVLLSPMDDAERERLVQVLRENTSAIIEPAKPPAKIELLSQGEQRAILEDAGAIIRLVNHHDVKETEADAADCAGAAAFHMKRAHELLTIGRCVILRDPDLWDDQLKQEFAPRAREG